jgi:hypothetical protein
MPIRTAARTVAANNEDGTGGWQLGSDPKIGSRKASFRVTDLAVYS